MKKIIMIFFCTISFYMPTHASDLWKMFDLERKVGLPLMKSDIKRMQDNPLSLQDIGRMVAVKLPESDHFIYGIVEHIYTKIIYGMSFEYAKIRYGESDSDILHAPIYSDDFNLPYQVKWLDRPFMTVKELDEKRWFVGEIACGDFLRYTGPVSLLQEDVNTIVAARHNRKEPFRYAKIKDIRENDKGVEVAEVFFDYEGNDKLEVTTQNKRELVRPRIHGCIEGGEFDFRCIPCKNADKKLHPWQ